ncbi:gluconeogenesis factor YvcK family protein [Candidatus Nanosynbacter sp. BB002]|uniref:gluconeogenesis factor YvcK family protein n=1 Tax=Candidatus Nanosynbacter sp. BB002 TaxID=3393757 RepID=UPI0030D05A51
MELMGINIVVIGGGTGSFTLLSGLKNYTHNITALVNMVDDGGSTGQLRDELGVLPAGDVRQCLVALSTSPKVRDLFNYRFDEGSMKGHAFGNLFMAALEKMTGNFTEAVKVAGEVLNIRGRVEPITFDNITLVTRLADGTVVRGQHEAESLIIPVGERPWLDLEPTARINPQARQAILSADLVVIAPGLLYGSLAPALLVSGVTRALAETKAKKVYVCNLVNKPGQTDEFTVADYASEIERFAGVKLDHVLYNNHRPSQELIDRYAKDGELLVEWNKEELKKKHFYASGKRLIADEVWENTNAASDPLAAQRSLIRHDADRVARELMRIYFA